MRLHFRVQGEGRPLIILHGFLGSLDNWQVMSNRLARDYKVYSVDLRNHGRSPHSEVMNYPVMAQDVHDLIAEQALAAPSVLGHSMGGKVAMQLAGQYSNDIERLIVVDIAPKSYPPAHRPTLQAMHNLNLRAYKSFGEVGAALAAAIPDPAVRQFIVKNLCRDAAGNFQWRLGLDQIIQNYGALTEAILVEKPFTKPAYFVRGGLSDFVRDNDMESIRIVFPRSEFETIPNAGHWVHIDAADAFYLAVKNFLSAIDRPGQS